MDIDPIWPVDVGAQFVSRLVEQITKHGIDPDVLLNVNLPNLPHDEIKGVQVTTLGKRIYEDQLIKREDPRGKTYYWIGGSIIRSEGDKGTDVAAVADGYVSVTPIHMDMTNHRLLETLPGSILYILRPDHPHCRAVRPFLAVRCLPRYINLLAGTQSKLRARLPTGRCGGRGLKVYI